MYPRVIKTYVHTKTCKRVFVVALYVIANPSVVLICTSLMSNDVEQCLKTLDINYTSANLLKITPYNTAILPLEWLKMESTGNIKYLQGYKAARTIAHFEKLSCI